MPVIRATVEDPTDVVVQGETLRAAGLALFAPVAMVPLLTLNDEPVLMLEGGLNLVEGEQVYGLVVGAYPVPSVEVLRDQASGSLVAANALISTPCGALVQVQIGQRMLTGSLGSTQRWVLSGVTRDAAGAPLGGCRVVVIETGRLAVTGTPVVAEATSDGGGNYSVEVPTNTAYQILAYKPGAPDVAGITRSDVTPTAVG